MAGGVEEWRQVMGFEMYEISDLGHVRRRIAGGSAIARAGRPLKLLTWTGYCRVKLHDGQRRRWCQVHRLVAEAFLGAAPSPQHQAAHGDGDPLNNAAANLRWATPAENNADIDRHGRRRRGEAHGSSVHTDRRVLAIRAIAAGGISHEMIAAAVGTSQSHISRIVRGEAWGHLS